MECEVISIFHIAFQTILTISFNSDHLLYFLAVCVSFKKDFEMSGFHFNFGQDKNLMPKPEMKS
jgi:hypothetical protein